MVEQALNILKKAGELVSVFADSVKDVFIFIGKIFVWILNSIADLIKLGIDKL